jgi:hypothetical protein
MALCDVSLWPNALERSAAASVYFFLLYDDGIAGGTMRIAACATLVLLLSTTPLVPPAAHRVPGQYGHDRARAARRAKAAGGSVEGFCISWPNIRD